MGNYSVSHKITLLKLFETKLVETPDAIITKINPSGINKLFTLHFSPKFPQSHLVI